MHDIKLGTTQIGNIAAVPDVDLQVQLVAPRGPSAAKKWALDRMASLYAAKSPAEAVVIKDEHGIEVVRATVFEVMNAPRP